MQFTMDLDSDGTTNGSDENVTYSLYDSGDDGDTDLGRNTGANNQPVAENIPSLSFTYTLADGTTVSTPAVLNQIRTVQISLTARTAEADADYSENSGYRTATLTTRVTVRNLGL